MKRIKNVVSSLIALAILFFVMKSGIFAKIVEFMGWLFVLNWTQSSVSLAGEIFVRVATLGISFSVVGIIFRTLHWFNKGAMKFAYFVVSTLVSFALCYVVMLLENYLLYIVIAMAVILTTLLAVGIVLYCRNIKRIKNTKV